MNLVKKQCNFRYVNMVGNLKKYFPESICGILWRKCHFFCGLLASKHLKHIKTNEEKCLVSYFKTARRYTSKCTTAILQYANFPGEVPRPPYRIYVDMRHTVCQPPPCVQATIIFVLKCINKLDVTVRREFWKIYQCNFEYLNVVGNLEKKTV